jgi:hypothetical protein
MSISIVSAQTPTSNEVKDYVIINEANHANVDAKVKAISTTKGTVRDAYNTQLNDKTFAASVPDQIASGIMSWDTIMDYVVYLLRFLSQAALLIGALIFIYNGYQYILESIGMGNPSSGNIKNAVIGICIVIFSYAIMKILTRAFLT